MEFAGEPIADTDGLQAQLGPSRIGQPTPAGILRGGELAMTLFQYGESMDFSSEVYVVNLHGGSNRPYFRRKDVFVYDAVPLAQDGGLVAAIETRGRMRTSPIPGKLRIFQNTGSEWREMRVDYHASGVRAVFAYVDDSHIWAATNEGVILKLS